jgi:hypothetical protein
MLFSLLFSPLSKVLDIIPENVDVELLKVDVQGMDVEVLTGCGKKLKRVRTVIVEVQDPDPNVIIRQQRGTQLVADLPLFFCQDETANIMYVGPPVTIAGTKAWMDAQGFDYDEVHSFPERIEIREWNLVFQNRNWKKAHNNN